MNDSTAGSSNDAAAAATAFIGAPVAPAVRMTLLVTGWGAAASGVLGNVLIISTLLSQPRLRSQHNLYIGNLALADLIISAYNQPAFLVDLVTGRHPVLNAAHCFFNAYLMAGSFGTSVLTLVAISVNRWLHVCHHSFFVRLFTRERTLGLCFLTWLLGFALVLPSALTADWGGHNTFYEPSFRSCAFRQVYVQDYSTWYCFVMVLLPSLLVGASNVAIFRHWRRSKARLSQWAAKPGPRGAAAAGCGRSARDTAKSDVNATTTVVASASAGCSLATRDTTKPGPVVAAICGLGALDTAKSGPRDAAAADVNTTTTVDASSSAGCSLGTRDTTKPGPVVAAGCGLGALDTAKSGPRDAAAADVNTTTTVDASSSAGCSLGTRDTTKPGPVVAAGALYTAKSGPRDGAAADVNTTTKVTASATAGCGLGTRDTTKPGPVVAAGCGLGVLDTTKSGHPDAAADVNATTTVAASATAGCGLGTRDTTKPGPVVAAGCGLGALDTTTPSPLDAAGCGLGTRDITKLDPIGQLVVAGCSLCALDTTKSGHRGGSRSDTKERKKSRNNGLPLVHTASGSQGRNTTRLDLLPVHRTPSHGGLSHDSRSDSEEEESTCYSTQDLSKTDVTLFTSAAAAARKKSSATTRKRSSTRKRRRKSPRGGHGGSRMSSSDVAMVRSLVAVFSCCVLLYLPMAVLTVMFVLGPVAPELCVGSIACALLNHNVNWLLYGLMNRAFREGYARQLRAARCGDGPRDDVF